MSQWACVTDFISELRTFRTDYTTAKSNEMGQPDSNFLKPSLKCTLVFPSNISQKELFEPVIFIEHNDR